MFRTTTRFLVVVALLVICFSKLVTIDSGMSIQCSACEYVCRVAFKLTGQNGLWTDELIAGLAKEIERLELPILKELNHKVVFLERLELNNPTSR